MRKRTFIIQNIQDNPRFKPLEKPPCFSGSSRDVSYLLFDKKRAKRELRYNGMHFGCTFEKNRRHWFCARCARGMSSPTRTNNLCPLCREDISNLFFRCCMCDRGIDPVYVMVVLSNWSLGEESEDFCQHGFCLECLYWNYIIQEKKICRYCKKHLGRLSDKDSVKYHLLKINDNNKSAMSVSR